MDQAKLVETFKAAQGRMSFGLHSDSTRVLATLQAAVAYQLLQIAEENGEPTLWHPDLLTCLRRMIQDKDYRAVVIDVWGEIFEQNEGEWYELLCELFYGSQLWKGLGLR